MLKDTATGAKNMDSSTHYGVSLPRGSVNNVPQAGEGSPGSVNEGTYQLGTPVKGYNYPPPLTYTSVQTNTPADVVTTVELGKILKERGNRYGDFTTHADIAMNIKRAIHIPLGWDRLNAVQQHALEIIADKIARILNGDPTYDDNWIDIQGYAKLVQDRLPK